MFWFRDDVGDAGRVGVAFTDATLDLQGTRPGFPDVLARLERTTGVGFARLHQVHGTDVVVVDAPGPDPRTPAEDFPVGDAMVTTTRGVGLMVRTADCVPVVLADPAAGVVGVAHAGREGMALGVVERALAAMTEQGATALTAWIGPHVCGGCYEVPAEMCDQVAALRPEARSRTRWGTPAIDVGAGVRHQLEVGGATVVDVGGCTLEDERLHSHRRDATASGRIGGLVWMR